VSESYYGHPVVKPHVWTPYVPLYFWIGGTAGAASAQMLLSRVRGNHTLARVQKRIALAGAAIAPVLLIVDLGVPKRFLNMLRVFKATSPMSVGSWVLSAFGAVLAASTAAEFAGWRRVSVALEVLTAGLGPALATYTAVLLADTATPIWNAARRELPFVFVASGVAGAGALAVWFTPSSAAAPARRFMVGGAFAVFVTTEVMERRLGAFIAEPYRGGRGGLLQRASTVCAVGGALVGLFAGRHRGKNRVAATLVVAAGLLERYAVFAAGKQSAIDPKYVVEPQRRRVDERAAVPTA
jgi:formate-dependent nitrite reductase membrane component NrfD